MKRVLALLLCASCLFSFASCSKKSKSKTPAATKKVPTSKTTEETTKAKRFDPDVEFEVVDMKGNTWDETMFQDYELTMIHFWEPSSDPCVREMKDLQKLYHDYEDLDFIILAVYSDTDMDDEIRRLIKNASTTYPVVNYSPAFDRFRSAQTPSTIFVDKEGKVIYENGSPYYDGAKEYEEWARIIEQYV